jgi:hypothetical protein
MQAWARVMPALTLVLIVGCQQAGEAPGKKKAPATSASAGDLVRLEVKGMV